MKTRVSKDGYFVDDDGFLCHDLVYRTPNYQCYEDGLPLPPREAPITPDFGEVYTKEEEAEVDELIKLRRQYKRKLRQEEIRRLKKLLELGDTYDEPKVSWRDSQ